MGHNTVSDVCIELFYRIQETLSRVKITYLFSNFQSHMCNSLAPSNHACHANDLFHHYISYHTICQESPEHPNERQGGISLTTPNSKSLHIKAKSTLTTLHQCSLRPSEKNTAGRIVQARTSAQITVELQTLCDSPETSTKRKH